MKEYEERYLEETQEAKKEIKEVIELINEFKRFSFEWANLFFGYLIIRRGFDFVDDLIDVSIETDDPRGIIGNEEYYDLLVFAFDGVSACIPVPLVTDKEELYRIMKRSNTVSRKKHDRGDPVVIKNVTQEQEFEALKRRALKLENFIGDLKMARQGLRVSMKPGWPEDWPVEVDQPVVDEFLKMVELQEKSLGRMLQRALQQKAG